MKWLETESFSFLYKLIISINERLLSRDVLTLKVFSFFYKLTISFNKRLLSCDDKFNLTFFYKLIISFNKRLFSSDEKFNLSETGASENSIENTNFGSIFQKSSTI